MIVKEEFLSKLRRYFSLNLYEVKIWTALLSRGVSTAGELSDIANVPRSRSYDVLESLEKKGFVIMKLGKPIKYIAVPPREVLERVKKNVQEKTRKEVTTIDLLKKGKMIEELMLLHERGIVSQDTLDISGSLTGRKNLYNHLEIMLKNAKKTVIMATNSERFSEKKDIFSGVFDVLAKANSPAGVKKITWSIDSAQKSTQTSEPFALHVEFPQGDKGSHTITVTLEDNNGGMFSHSIGVTIAL